MPARSKSISKKEAKQKSSKTSTKPRSRPSAHLSAARSASRSGGARSVSRSATRDVVSGRAQRGAIITPAQPVVTSASQLTGLKRGMGWLPDRPDFRDYHEETEAVREIIDSDERLKREFGRALSIPGRSSLAPLSRRTAPGSLPTSIDLRDYCSPVEDQGMLGSCTAHAGVGLIEYYERRAFGRHLDASRLFLYKVTRNLMKLRGDTGAYLRTTMGAMVLFGVPPESYWPYTDDATAFDREPPAFCYAFAQNFQTIKYFRHDPPGTAPGTLLHSLKTYLAKGFPFIFGFSVYNSIEQAETTGRIPFPSPRERMEGGHAIMAVGYDDTLEITNKFGNLKTTGALLIRNSWGSAWGERGYGWLPYDYVLRGLAEDFWSILKKEWVDTTAFAE